jgi:hypothetical protein
MEVSLRKADQLANAVKELLQTNNEISYGITVSAFDKDWRDKIHKERSETEKKVTRLTMLHRCLAGIRSAVGRANAECGINDILAMDNLYKNMINMLTPITQVVAMESESVIERTLEAAKTPKDGGRYGWDQPNYNLTVNIIDAAYIEKVKTDISNLKKQRREISDELIAKNVTVKVKLPAEVVDTLKAENLI